MPGRRPGLTAKQSIFVDEYLVDGNATRAAREAGYAEKSCEFIGWENQQKPKVAAAIAKAQEARAQRTEITADKVLRELAKLGFSNMEDFAKVNEETGSATLDLSDISRDQFAAVTELTTDSIGEVTTRTKIKLADKRANLELLGKHLGMFKPVGGADNPLRFKAEPIDLSGWSAEDLRALSRLQAKVAASGSGD